MPKSFYISTAIHYVNDLPHIGHIYENVVGDVIARFRRASGDDVFLLTGTDEHGQKIERSAAKQGISPIELADRVVAYHKELWLKLGISNDDFIRTTENRHRIAVYELIRRIRERLPDDIYLGEHSGWYCSNEETFVPDSQVADGRCENGHPVERTTERNYFFRLSRYGAALLDHYRSNPGFIQPPTRYNEVVSFVESGLKDLSISRTAIGWGIPFPDEPEHVIYVWMDALTNYISALGFGSAGDERFRRWWPADIHLIGKDIVRFHAVYWPAFLMAAGLPLPKTVLAHGWWLRDNEKISKSAGNIVRPIEIIDRFGVDPFRYYLMREMVFGQDSNYSDEAFFQRYNSDLANDLGNTLSRAIKMSDNYFGGRTPPTPCDDNELLRATEQLVPLYIREMEAFNFQRAIEAASRLVTAINGYIVSREPWKHFKEQGADESLSRMIWNALESLRIVWTMMAPIMPAASREALRRLGADPDAIGREELSWGRLRNDQPITVADPIFPRIDAAGYFSEAETRLAKGAIMPEEIKTPEPAEPVDERATAGPPLETTQAVPPDVNRVTIDQFGEIDLRVAEIVAAEKVAKSKKLMMLRVSTGDAERTVVAGIAANYSAEELIGRKVVIVANLQPAKLMGIESNGMVLAASIEGEPSLLSVDSSVPPGTKVR
ncbi:MAG TPA: methionine--tRNA ligase [Thermoanaerobaculia bacterium]|nr:methionine--tRNA ligase [Thermoanaerobaculia bacterium]